MNVWIYWDTMEKIRGVHSSHKTSLLLYPITTTLSDLTCDVKSSHVMAPFRRLVLLRTRMFSRGVTALKGLNRSRGATLSWEDASLRGVSSLSKVSLLNGVNSSNVVSCSNGVVASREVTSSYGVTRTRGITWHGVDLSSGVISSSVSSSSWGVVDSCDNTSLCVVSPWLVVIRSDFSCLLEPVERQLHLLSLPKIISELTLRAEKRPY